MLTVWAFVGLLGEKGVHTDPGTTGGGPDAGDSKPPQASQERGAKEPMKLGEKLKSKLHKTHGPSS